MLSDYFLLLTGHLYVVKTHFNGKIFENAGLQERKEQVCLWHSRSNLPSFEFKFRILPDWLWHLRCFTHSGGHFQWSSVVVLTTFLWGNPPTTGTGFRSIRIPGCILQLKAEIGNFWTDCKYSCAIGEEQSVSMCAVTLTSAALGSGCQVSVYLHRN